MFSIGPLKPVLTALLLPPGGPLLLIFLAGLLARRFQRSAWAVVLLSSLAMWLLVNQQAVKIGEGIGHVENLTERKLSWEVFSLG
jgi:hypothetical protein